MPKIRNKEYLPKGWTKMKLSSLAYRRGRRDMNEVYKYTHSVYKVHVQPVEVDLRRTRDHSYKLHLPTPEVLLHESR